MKIMRPYLGRKFADGFDMHGLDHAAVVGDPFY
jgi:hypothetical protein